MKDTASLSLVYVFVSVAHFAGPRAHRELACINSCLHRLNGDWTLLVRPPESHLNRRSHNSTRLLAIFRGRSDDGHFRSGNR